MPRLAALWFGSLSLLLTVSAPAETFRNPPQFHTGTATLTLITADINGDQIPDIVYLDANGMHVLLGKGDGTFTRSADITTPPGVYGFITAADVNKDGRLDLLMPGTILTGFTSTAYLGVALQNADGTFQPMSVTTIPDSNTPAYNNSVGAVTNVSVADFNGDGNPDVVFGNGVTTAIYVLFGDGKGKFTLNSTLSPMNTSPSQAFALDLNGDGHADILIHTAYDAIVFLNKGDGTFAAGTPIFDVRGSSSIGETAVLLHDMNGDGVPDILSVDFSGELEYVPGRRDGTFGSPVQLAQLNSLVDPVPAAVGDFNHDGVPDIALTTHDGVAILLGQGADKFAAPQFFNGASYPYLPAVADFNGDGNLDFAESAGDGIVFLLGNHDGTLQSLSSFPQGENIGAAAVGDFNNDGIQDVAYIGATGFVSVAFGKGDGTLLGKVASPTGDNALAGQLIPGRFNGTDSLDLLETYPYPFAAASVLRNHGDGTFDQATPGGFSDLPILFPAAVDLNGDGLTDLVGSDPAHNEISFLTDIGKQSFTTFNITRPNFYSGPFAVGHFHKNKVADVASCNAYGSDANTFNGAGDGTATQGATFATLGRCRDLAVGDFDGDGNQDFILLFEDPNSAQSFDLPVAQIFYGNGDGTFQPPVEQPLARGYLRVTAGDLNGDGIDDMVFTDQLGVAVLHGNRSRTFGAEDHYVAGTSPYKPLIADMNGDGIPDLVFANVDPEVFVSRFDFTGFHATVANATTIVVLLGQDPHLVQGTLTFAPEPSIVGQPFTITAQFVPSVPGSGNPTGTVDFRIDGAAPFTVPLTGSSATATGPATLMIGAHTITASYNGDSFFKHSTISAQHSVIGLATATVLSAAPNPANFGQDVAFTATVSAVNKANVPTGSVSFLDAGTAIGTGTLDVNGVARYDTTALAAGAHPITAVFAATSNFAQSTSNAVTEQIVASGPPPGPADFNITATPSKQTGERGVAAIYVITITPLNGFNLPVSLDCPATLPSETVCSITPGHVISGGSGTTTVLLQTTTAHPVRTAKMEGSGLPWKVTAVAVACVILIRPHRRKALLLLLAGMMLTGGGCGSPGDLGTTPGSYAMSIKGTAVGNAALSHSAGITLVVLK